MKMRSRRFRTLAAVPLAYLFAAGAAVTAAAAQVEPPEPPALILFIVVDQLRGEAPLRMAERFGPGGFRYLLERGRVYTNAHYGYANTETAPGHATLATGAYPSAHGLVANDWYDRMRDSEVYSVEDPEHRLIGEELRAGAGTSPRNLLATTIGDELVLASGGRARVFGVSLKDRGAILMAGHSGKAFWYDTRSGRFVTSTYYYGEYPGWVEAWNAKRMADSYAGKAWELLAEPASYEAAWRDDRPWERALEPLGTSFPHSYGWPDGARYHWALRYTPAADEMTVDFAKALVEAESLGGSGATDLLAVSLSATDYIGHRFGPASLEYEDQLLRVDRRLADLLGYVDERVGLERTLVVLSSDHGSPEIPEYAAELGLPGGRLERRALERRLNEALRARFATDVDLLASYTHPYLYLDLGAVRRLGLDLGTAERALAEAALATPGIAAAVTRGELLSGRLPDTPLYQRVARNFHPDRSGQVHIVGEFYWYVHSDAQINNTIAHGSPWGYDTHVPIMIAGPGITAGRVSQPVRPQDVAPTLAAYLGIRPPSASAGRPLPTR